jgi:two-component system response regulator RegA
VEEQKTALIIDDDNVFRNRMCRAIADRGWEVVGAPDPDHALELARTMSPDLAIVDLRLSDSSGLELIPQLRIIDETICIIILTGYGSIPTALAATRLGADHFLNKPADADQILSAYERIVTGHQEELGEPTGSVPTLARVEWEHIQRVLNDCGGNVSQAAKLLGLHRRSLQRKLYKMPPAR